MVPPGPPPPLPNFAADADAVVVPPVGDVVAVAKARVAERAAEPSSTCNASQPSSSRRSVRIRLGIDAVALAMLLDDIENGFPNGPSVAGCFPDGFTDEDLETAAMTNA